MSWLITWTQHNSFAKTFTGFNFHPAATAFRDKTGMRVLIFSPSPTVALIRAWAGQASFSISAVTIR